MPGFQDATGSASTTEWDLKMLPFEQMKAAPALAIKGPVERPQTIFRNTESKAAPPAAHSAPLAPTPEADASPANPNDTAAEALAINGSVNNGAASIFSQSGAFGNARQGRGSPYTGNIGVVMNNSSLNANSYSLTGRKPKARLSSLADVSGFGWAAGDSKAF